MEREYASTPTESKENMKCDGKYTNGQKFVCFSYLIHLILFLQTEGSFVKRCVSTPYSAAIEIFGCLSPSGKDIAIGSKVEEVTITQKSSIDNQYSGSSCLLVYQNIKWS